jgi:hypothetical protein
MLSADARRQSMRRGAVLPLVLVGAIAAAGLVVTAGTASADVQGNLVSCDATEADGTDIGDAKFAPGLSTTEKKQTITATIAQSGCVANDAELDEIASESKIGVTKTLAAGRGVIAAASVKAKFTTFADCLGIVVADPDDTGEYPAYGSFQVKWLTAALGTASGTVPTTATVQLVASASGASVTGVVVKGLGAGGNLTATAGFAPRTDGSDDFNGNASPDFVDCAVFADPTAVAKVLDVTAVTGTMLSIDIP